MRVPPEAVAAAVVPVVVEALPAKTPPLPLLAFPAEGVCRACCSGVPETVKTHGSSWPAPVAVNPVPVDAAAAAVLESVLATNGSCPRGAVAMRARYQPPKG
jgi:hypothetical protein